jgi:predicted PurR-regulated permease PerM
MKQKSWLNIIILLFIIFIIIPIVLKFFNINLVEGLTNLSNDSSESLNIINTNLMDICDNMFSDEDANKKLDDLSGNMIVQILNSVKSLSNKIDQKETPQLEKLKCIASFGTNIGDDLPNGSGILTNTKYVCPSEYPSCKGLVCGRNYGTCAKN